MVSTIGLNIKALKKEPFSGSYQGMRYYLYTKEDTLSVFLYPEPWSFERTPEEDKEQKDFPFTQEGMDDAIDWINQSYKAKRPYWEQKAKDRMKLLL
nr:GNAT family acetyltransferase [uncultured Merdimonas sp.]